MKKLHDEANASIGCGTRNFILCTTHWQQDTTHWELHIAYCTMHTAHYKLHTVHCTLHTAHCTLQSSIILYLSLTEPQLKSSAHPHEKLLHSLYFHIHSFSSSQKTLTYCLNEKKKLANFIKIYHKELACLCFWRASRVFFEACRCFVCFSEMILLPSWAGYWTISLQEPPQDKSLNTTHQQFQFTKFG